METAENNGIKQRRKRVIVINRDVEWEDVKAKYKIRSDGKLATWRPTKKTEEVIKKLCEAFEIDCTVEEACSHAWITKATYMQWCREDKEFVYRMKQAKHEFFYKMRQANIAKNTDIKLGDPLKVLSKRDARYRDKWEIEHTWEISIIAIAKQAEENRRRKESGGEAIEYIREEWEEWDE